MKGTREKASENEAFEFSLVFAKVAEPFHVAPHCLPLSPSSCLVTAVDARRQFQFHPHAFFHQDVSPRRHRLVFEFDGDLVCVSRLFLSMAMSERILMHIWVVM
jgi:hypothetical protein